MFSQRFFDYEWLHYKLRFVFFDAIYLKGALDNFSLIPNLKKKVEIFISLEVYTYVVTAC